ncbi:flagellar export protein FliJ [Citrobacter sp. JGM124]|uniref:flagellar export protein FliJ n=1 Tax=Citrobacter sp. JGM124 TaxID=2799789 RepID=UPI001BA46813|nr:flagellar export protein FliJ [Citrobacter sp. JGM124]MBS0846951.1 flagella biosynthesis chaperone FliJ [Citrobacter sp. JGM124]
MAQPNALDTLSELASKEVDKAAIMLGDMRQGYQQAEQQLGMLMNYQDEYRSALNSSLSQGMANTRWHNYQQFILTLEKAIEQHRQQLMQWNHKVEQALNVWREKKKKLQAWQTLQERKTTQALLAENRLDQKQMDEYAQRATLRKGE